MLSAACPLQLPIYMDLREKVFFSVLLILAVATNGTQADAMVTGTVFCDQCKDDQISLFDYPVNGAKVTLSCGDGTGQLLMSREETTNWSGIYTMRFDGTPDMSNCSAYVSGSGQGSMGCGEAAGPSQNLRLVFRMFAMEMYAVDPLLAQPAQPMQYCPKSSPPSLLLPPVPELPPFSLPPMPELPPLLPMMSAKVSACPHE